MAERRALPSPLIFENSIGSQSHASGSGPNTVSMPFVRRHVTRRLKAAKSECDKELQRVTNNITAFFEERLREGDQEDDQEPLKDPFGFHLSDLRSALQAEESGSDGGYEAEAEPSRHSRHPSSASSMSPASLRRHSTNLWDRPLNSSVSSSTVASSPAASNIVLPDVPITRKQPSTSNASNWSNSQSLSSRRLSRSIHIPPRPSHSGQSSRSTSRSRSPLPPVSTHASLSDQSNSGPPTSNRRASRILIDDPVDPIMTALYDLIGVCTDIVDMSITQLTAQPKVCESLVGRVQSIGKAWDEHPDWHGRNWYVQVLLAVASLSRVVEWWEAEKQFWNFDDNENEQDEPLTFVTKSVEEPPAPTPTTVKRQTSDLDSFKLNADDENKLRLHRPASMGRRSRDVHPKELTMSAIPSEETSRSTSKAQEHSESARVLATERLRLQAETAQNQNIVMELSLDGDHLIWVNHAWNIVVGTDPEELYGTRVSRLLAPGDWNVLREATHRLQEDDSHTVAVRFRLQIEPDDGTRDVPPSAGTLYQQMEGKGMLMIDREDGEPSHTMWVVRPIASPRYENDSRYIALETGDAAPEPATSFATAFMEGMPQTEPAEEAPFPFPLPISLDPILCRICENQIPQWYFEKHSETCAETHRLEAEITDFNESIDELRNTIRDLAATMDREPDPTNGSEAKIPEYRGMPILSPSTSPVAASPLQLLNRANRMMRFGVKKTQRRLLDQLEDILSVAAEIAIPALKEDEAKEPIERQRLLSPGSERKITSIRTWAKPTVDDNALSQLIVDAERVMRGKVDNVVRMQNTIRYAEKIWREWEEKVAAMVNDGDSDGSRASENGDEDGETKAREEDEGSSDAEATPGPDDASGDEGAEGDASSTKSEYAFSGETPPASKSESPLATSDAATVAPSPRPIPPLLEKTSPSMTIPTPPSYVGRGPYHTRSSTPSSISSPLALAAPIVASASPDEVPPPMKLDPSEGPSSVRSRSSLQNLLEPKVVVTPPASPQVVPKDDMTGGTLKRDSSSRQSHRRQSTVNPTNSPSGPLSPRQPSTAPIARHTPTSIKDFEIIKPISKGAFGSVFLAKKKVTGDYFAIKVLKKADMIAKNQITNVKAERMILMKQAESPFVAKLFFTFQSKENLYLVMEYLNGGDCAALIKSLGCLPEEWTRNYIAEVILGLEYLHQRGVVHRDLKPDNLLIDQHGHLKLTDFGLSRIGLLGRQTRERDAQLGFGRSQARYNSRSRPPSIDSAYLSSPLTFADITAAAAAGGSYFNQRTASVPRYGYIPYSPPTDDVSESSGSESVLPRRLPVKSDSPHQSFASELTTDLRSHSHSASGGGGTPPGDQKFVGTPDYLAPETILGLRGDDAAVDWWALGVITYEFLYGIPPFHAESPERVFENILSGHIEWHEEWIEFSEEARDFMARLMILDPSQRLGANGADEVKAHPFLHDIEWDKVTMTEAAFIPQITDPESTDYFDPRGAIPQWFQDDDQIALPPGSVDSPVVESSANSPPPPLNIGREPSATSPSSDDFGSFSFKNLPVLKQANDDVIRKLKTDQMAPMAQAFNEPAGFHSRKRSISHRMKKPPSVVTTMDPKTTNPPSPATSTSSLASSPSRASIPPSTPGSANSHARKLSDVGAVERFKVNHLEGEKRMPSRLRTASVSSAGDGSGSETWNSSTGHNESNTPPSSVHSIDLKKGPDPNDRAVTCLLAEDNPITAKIIETLLIRLGCRCVVVADGSEAISVAMGDIKFDCILMDLHMPVLDGEGAARYIKSTNGKNALTPIIAVSAYSDVDPYEDNNVFAGYLAKPLQKADLITVMRQLGFKTATVPGPGPTATKVTASAIQAIS